MAEIDNMPRTSRSIRDVVVDTREPYIEADLEHVTTGSIHEHRILAAVCLPLVYKNDLIGVIYADSGRIIPKFVRRYADLGTTTRAALASYVDDVRTGRFPDREHSYGG